MNIFVAGNQVCMKRGLDAERFKQYIEANGARVSSTPDEADVVVAVTCAFVESYADYAVAMLRSLDAEGRRLIVLGCLPSMFPAKSASVFQGDWLPVHRFDEIDRLFPGFTVPWSAVPDANFPDTGVMLPFVADAPCPTAIRNCVSDGKRIGPILRVGEGCNNQCSYCSHPAALGPLRSKPIEECVRECRALAAGGARRITIHANDPAAYGVDIGLTYPELLRACLGSCGPEVSFTLNDVGPGWLLKYRSELLDLMASGRIAGLGLPLQSGSPRILRLMRRPGATAKILEAVSAFRAAAPGLSVSSHLIAGFPTETDEDVAMTVEMIRQLSPSSVYVFRYSANPQTPAAKLQPQFTATELQARQSELVSLLGRATTARIDAFA